jgi:cell division protein FtsA
MLEGLVDVAEHILDLPVRKGIPTDVGGLVDAVSSPMYATGVGLILYALRDTEHHEPVYHANGRIVTKVFDRMKGWLKELF